MTKPIILAGLLVAGPAAHASFELLLQAGSGVTRLDGDTGTGFGSFANSAPNIAGVALDQNRNRLYVASRDFTKGNEGTTLLAYNYNTGELINQRYFGTSASKQVQLSVEPNTGRILVNYGNSITFCKPESLSVDAVFSLSAVGFVVNSSALYVRTTTELQTWVPSAGSYVLANAIGLASSTNAVMAISGSRMIMSDGVTNTRYNIGSGLPVSLGNFPASGTVTGLGFGHNEKFYASYNISGEAAQRIQPIFFDTGRRFGGEYVTASPFYGGGLAVVVAPEPGSLLALGIGAGLVLRRRRRSSAT